MGQREGTLPEGKGKGGNGKRGKGKTEGGNIYSTPVESCQ